MSAIEPAPRRRCHARTALPALVVLTVALLAAGCEKRSKEETPQSPVAAAATATPPPVVASPVTQASWAPDALEELLAPIALYPDQLLMQVLAASVNAQEVLDGGNWLLQNQNLKGEALDAAASKAGFGAAMRALLEFPTVVDMLCQEIDWTRQLGSAVTSDQKSVLDAVQRLRAQATKVGNLQSTPQQTVETKTENDKVIVEVKPANPEVVYVPQYNPQAVYSTPPPAPAAAPATTVVDDDDTVSTDTAILGGVLAFGAGVLVANAFDDDDDDDCCYANWGGSTVVVGARPFYPAAYAYRPAYGSGFRPAYGYAPPAGYRNSYNRNTNNNININNNNNYYNRFSKDQNLRGGAAQSPLRASQQPAAANARDRNQASTRGDNWKGQSTYQGRSNTATNTRDRNQASARGDDWKGQSTYQGRSNDATNARSSQAADTRAESQRRQETARTSERAPDREPPARPPSDRGYDPSGMQDRSGDREQARAETASPRAQEDAFSGTRGRDGGSFDRSASARGRASSGGMQQREARAGGGGGRRRG